MARNSRSGDFRFALVPFVLLIAAAGPVLGRIVRQWADIMLATSPTALKVLKLSFNADTEAINGISSLAWDSLDLFVRTP